MRQATTLPVADGAARRRAGRTTSAGELGHGSTRTERSEPPFHFPKVLQGSPGVAHGDPFPLPVFRDLQAGDRRGMPRYRVQRETRRLKRASLLTEAAVALKRFLGCPRGRPSRAGAVPRSTTAGDFNRRPAVHF